jgi:hypothetical protein
MDVIKMKTFARGIFREVLRYFLWTKNVSKEDRTTKLFTRVSML